MKARRFESKKYTEQYIAENNISGIPCYESGYYEAVTGYSKGWYIQVGRNGFWVET